MRDNSGTNRLHTSQRARARLILVALVGGWVLQVLSVAFAYMPGLPGIIT